MAPFPLHLTTLLAPVGTYLVYMLIGFGFGYVLEISGFGYSPKLAAQFYFKDMTVLKVMFTAIIVAMLLIFASSALGWLDYNLVWVNPTYLWPGIIGGLIMGVGFIVGGFCPGTSLVAAATFKIDGLFFVLGGLAGFFLFGETVDLYSVFYNSSYMGRFTLPELFGISTGWVVLLVILMALFMFFGSELLEKYVGKQDISKAPRWRFAAAGALVLGAIAVLLIGQPTTADRWAKLSATKQPLLDERQVYIHPGELLANLNDRKLQVTMLDVRPEADYNLFHIAEAERVSIDEIELLTKQFQMVPPNTVYVIMSNDETASTQAWKTLVANSVPNVYILEGGINNWLATFGQEDPQIQVFADGIDEELRCAFAAALGSEYAASSPSLHDFELNYTPKIKLDLKRGPTKGGCG